VQHPFAVRIFQGLLVGLRRGLVIPSLILQCAEGAPAVGLLGRDLNGLADKFPCPIRIAFGERQAGQTEQRTGRLGVGLAGLLECHACRLWIIRAEQRGTAQTEQFGPQRGRHVVADLGEFHDPRMLALRHQRFHQRRENFRVDRPVPTRALEFLFGSCRIAVAEIDLPEQQAGSRVVRVVLEESLQTHDGAAHVA
jgi:hypothetical protein